MERRSTPKSPQDVLVLCRERDVRAVDLRFTDLIGRQHHTTVPVHQLTEASFEDGFGIMGPSLRGMQGDADMLLIPQPETAWVDPFPAIPTLAMTCAIMDPVTREEYARDPRHIARRAQNYLLNTGVADVALFGPEAQFFIFDSVQFDQTSMSAFYTLDRAELAKRGGGGSNLGHQLAAYQGYSPCPPLDQIAYLRDEMMQTLIECGINVECHHHGAAASGQAEINFRCDGLLEVADALMAYKYIVKNVAHKYGKAVTFMPKPIVDDAGSSMHVHFSLWKSGEPLFAGTGYAGLSDAGLHAIGGVLKHAPALLAITNPTTNSYKRLVPGQNTPVHLAYSQRQRSAACRIPMTSPSPKARRVEFRCPDPSCNPYLAFSAILMAVIDGIQNKIHPGNPLDGDAFDELREGVPADVPQTPRSLELSLAALETDCDFLLRGDVFTEEILRNWIEVKQRHEIAPLAERPHPYEFCLYYDA